MSQERPSPEGVPEDALAELVRRVQRLEAIADVLLKHVSAIEQGRVWPPAPGEAGAQKPEVAPVPAPAELPRPPAPPLAPPVVAAAQAEVTPGPVATSAPVPPPPPPPPPPPAIPRGEGLELEIARKWMVRVGVFGLLLAAAFFLQHAFRSGWIGPRFQVTLGVLVSVALLYIGDQQRRLGRRPFGEALVGGGLAMLYTSIYAAYALYTPRLIDRPVALVAMVMVTALGVVMAVQANAFSTVVLATLGGFLTPVLVRAHIYGGPAGATAEMAQLFGYMLVLDVGLLALSFYRRWLGLQILCFACTWLLTWGWLGEGYETRLLAPMLGFLFLLFAVFVFVPVARNLWQRVRTREVDLILLLANPLFFFLTSFSLLRNDYAPLRGFLAIAMALLYLGLGYLAFTRNRDDHLLSLSWLGIGLAFVVAVAPLELEGAWIMVAWAAEGAALVWIGARIRSRSLPIAGLGLLGVSSIWMLTLYEMRYTRAAFTPFVNETFVAFAAGLGALALALSFYVTLADRLEEAKTVRLALGIALGVLALWGLTGEVSRTFGWLYIAGMVPFGTAKFAVSALWCAYAAAFVVVGLKRRSALLRWFGLGVFGLAVLKVFIYDLASLQALWRVLSFVCLSLLLIGMSYLYHLYGDQLRGLLGDGAAGASTGPGTGAGRAGGGVA